MRDCFLGADPHAGDRRCPVRPGGRLQSGATIKPVKGILPSGLGDDVDRDIARARAATARFRNVEAAVSAGYPATRHCVENQPPAAWACIPAPGALRDTTLDVEKPEILVYEKMADGSIRLNGVEHVVPIARGRPSSRRR